MGAQEAGMGLRRNQDVDGERAGLWVSSWLLGRKREREEGRRLAYQTKELKLSSVVIGASPKGCKQGVTLSQCCLER